jgi:hypothetical protein
MGYLSSILQRCTVHNSLVPLTDTFSCFIQVVFSQLQQLLISVSPTNAYILTKNLNPTNAYILTKNLNPSNAYKKEQR